MALAYIENPEALSLPDSQQHSADTVPIHALPGSSLQRSFLLDSTIHVVNVWTYPRAGMGDMISVSSVRSFDDAGNELAPWRVLGSGQYEDRRAGGLYTQTDIQPEGAAGRMQISWLRIPHTLGETALFAAPQSMPREMKMVELHPKFVARINNAAHQVAQLSVVK